MSYGFLFSAAHGTGGTCGAALIDLNRIIIQEIMGNCHKIPDRPAGTET
jgi:hypothetical protein